MPIIEMIKDTITQKRTKSVCDQRSCSGFEYPVIPGDWLIGYDAFDRIVIIVYLYMMTVGSTTPTFIKSAFPGFDINNREDSADSGLKQLFLQYCQEDP